MQPKVIVIAELLTRTWDDLVGRTGGPLSPRFVMQPLVSIALAIRAGLRDAAAERPAYLSAIWRRKAQRAMLLREGWKDIARLATIACALDALYQLVVLRGFYPLQTAVIVCALAIAPYVLTRGPVNRLASRRRHRK